MDVQQLAQRAIDKIKSQWGLPKRGFITGGSISNLIWEEVSGTKAIINDIDVFLFDGLLENYDEDRKEYFFHLRKMKKMFGTMIIVVLDLLIELKIIILYQNLVQMVYSIMLVINQILTTQKLLSNHLI